MGSQAQPSPSNLTFWLRAFQIVLTTKVGTYTLSNSQHESLRVTFSIDQYIYPLKAYWQAEVVIYNLSPAIVSAITQGTTNLQNPIMFATPLNMGDFVSISGGYQYGSSGAWNPTTSLLYNGRVFQSIITRENVVDYKMTLRLITALAEDILNVASVPIAKGMSQLDIINQILLGSKNGIPIDQVDDASQNILSNIKQPGSLAIKDRPLSVIQDIVKQNNLYSWISPNGLNIRSFGPQTFQQTPAYAYGPPNLPGNNYAPNGTTTGVIKKTLLGVPSQTQDSMTFRVLMDSTPKIGDLVQLAPDTIVQAVALQYGGQQLPPLPSQTGVYVIGGLHHYGDNRGKGDDWYTEILGLSVDYFTNFLGSRTLGAVLSNVNAATQFIH